MSISEMPEISFRSFAEFKNSVKSFKNTIIAKDCQTVEIYYKEASEGTYRDIPTEVPPEGAEVLADMTGCLEFVNDYLAADTIQVAITCLTKPDFYTINTKFVKHQTVAAILLVE